MANPDQYTLKLADEILSTIHMEYPGAILLTDNNSFTLVLCDLSRELVILDEKIIAWAPTLETLHRMIIRNSRQDGSPKNGEPLNSPGPKQ